MHPYSWVFTEQSQTWCYQRTVFTWHKNKRTDVWTDSTRASKGSSAHSPLHCTARHHWREDQSSTGGTRFYRHDHEFYHSQHFPVNSPTCQAQRPTASTEYSRQHLHCDCHCVTPGEMLSPAGFSPSAPRQVICLTAPSLSVCLSHPKCA